MPCNTQLKPKQTLSQRADELRKAVASIDKLLASGRAQVKTGPQGAVVFTGIPDSVRDGMTDTCIYRTLTRTASPQVKMQLARLNVNSAAVRAGIHSHDGGATWHPKG